VIDKTVHNHKITPLNIMPSSTLKVFASPERYVQGRNATEHLGTEMKKLAMKGPVVIVSSGSPMRLLEATWEKSLQENGYDFTNMDFGGICTAEEAQRIADEAVRTGSKTLVAFGGGQVIDAVRAAVGLVGDGSTCEFVSCPTVASTDGPCSALCVMYQRDHSFHEYRFMRRHPTLVLVDTTAVAQSPRRMLVSGLGDALATWYEARAVSEAKAENFLGGMPTETSYALSNHNGLTSQPATGAYTHGEKVAFGLITQLVLEGRPKEELDQVLEFCVTVGLPVTLGSVGVDADNNQAIKEIAERALAPGESSHKEPCEVTVDMMMDALRAADHAGTLLKQNNL
jgi:glycerol dehydrogenase